MELLSISNSIVARVNNLDQAVYSRFDTRKRHAKGRWDHAPLGDDRDRRFQFRFALFFQRCTKKSPAVCR